MSLDLLPERVAPFKLSSRNATVRGSIPLHKLVRLGEYLSSQNGKVEADLLFALDGENHRSISGAVKASLSLLCQRCLEETEINLEARMAVTLLQEGKDKHGQIEKRDVIEVSEDTLDLWSLVEDELILSLPIVAYHDEKDCNDTLSKLRLSDKKGGSIKKNPFAALEALKKDMK